LLTGVNEEGTKEQVLGGVVVPATQLSATLLA
jgi:hypothetical protein